MGKALNSALRVSVLLLAFIGIAATFGSSHAKHSAFADSIQMHLGSNNATRKVYINEVMSSNAFVLSDEDGDFSDWIELANPGITPVNLSGHYLSDDLENTLKWMFPRGTIVKPGGYLLIWASGKDKVGNGGEIHTSFSINREGEPLILTGPDGHTVIDYIEIPKMSRNVSYGRQPDAKDNFVYFNHANASPGRSNNDTSADTDMVFSDLNPVFSKAGGFYNEAFELEISAEPGVSVYYTLDGSVPAKDSIRYDFPIEIKKESISTDFPVQTITEGVRPKYPLSYIETNPAEADERMRWRAPEKEIFKAVVVRARAYDPHGNMSEVITHTYFVNENMNERYTLPVVSLAMEIDDLFDFEKGIYIPGKVYEEEGYGESYWGVPNANYFQRGREWERPAHISFFEPNGAAGFSLNGGIRIHGSASRVLPQKSLKFYARGEYDAQNIINYDVFQEAEKSGKTEANYKTLILRNGGQEFYKTIIKDMMLQSLMEDTDIDIQSYRPVIVFINGEYWGIHNLQQRFDLHYLANQYNVDTSQVAILGSNGALDKGEPGSENHYKAMLSYVKINDMSNERHYEYVKTLMDIDNYINYMVFQIYIGNYDWPGNNVYIWRYTGDYDPDAPHGLDGRWRWMIYDLDSAFGYKDVSYNTLKDIMLTEKEGSEKSDWSTRLFRDLLENDEFRNKVISCFATQMNTLVKTDRIIDRIDYFEELLLPEMQEHINRWNGYPRSTIGGWRQTIEKLREYATQRPEHMLDHLSEAFDLEETSNVNLVISDPQHGRLKISNIEIGEDDYPWTGSYFTGIPIEITAHPEPGCSFVGWKGFDEKSETLTIIPTEDIEITALFQKGSNVIPDDDLSQDEDAAHAAPLLLLLPMGLVLTALVLRIRKLSYK